MDLGDLDAKATLAVAEDEVATRRRQGVDRLLLLQHWADLHSEDPQARPGAVPLSRGGDRLIRLGGEGTPMASELCWAELAIALETGVISLRNQAGQALDLRHRLPLLWAAVQELRVEPWVAQKVAAMTRELTKEQVGIVDAAVAEAIDESPGRMLAIAEAKTIEADLEGYRARLAADEHRTGVWISRPRPGDLVDADQGEPGTRRVSAKLPAPDAVEGDAMIDDVADALAVHGDHDPDAIPTRDQLRAEAFTLLMTQPHAAAALLDEQDAAPSAEEPPSVRPKRKRRPAIINVHLTDQVLGGQADGHRPGGGPGPDAARADRRPGQAPRHHRATGHRPQQRSQCQRLRAPDRGEAPDPAAHRLRRVPPQLQPRLRRLDHDHATPYDAAGPPGQTGDHNDAPLIRFHHRVKTHDGYVVDQLGLGDYRWVTRHGLARIVTPRGTKRVELIRTRDGAIFGQIHRDAFVDIDYPRRS